MNKIKEQIRGIAFQYNLQIIYAFGRRAKEALDLVEDRIEHFASIPSDLDIGVKPEKHLTGAMDKRTSRKRHVTSFPKGDCFSRKDSRKESIRFSPSI
jgi:hypothetical protein